MTMTNPSVNLSTLYDADFADVAVDGIQRFYGLTDSVTFGQTRGSEEVTIRADDGSGLTLCSKPTPKKVR